MRHICCIAIVCIGLFFHFANATEPSALFQKLVEGSPWRFATKYENTEWSFRVTSEGALERHFPDGQWRKLTVSEDGSIKYDTINGHVITILLDKDGKPMATHSKHSSSFKSTK